MPIYEYRCAACGHELEAIQKFSEDPLTDCPSCGKPELKKLLSAAGFQLKGGGWYQTDFKGGAKGKPAESETKSDDSRDGGGRATQDAKADAKPDTKPQGCGGGGCGCH
jgi:putative FmdB family regulatory protein